MLLFTMMKNRPLATTIFAVCSAILPLTIAMFASSAQAQLTWGPAGAGGAGTWDSSTAHWYNGASAVAWDSTSATFAGTAGNVTVSGTQNLTELVFTPGFYTLNGGILNFTGSTPTISGAGGGETINSTIVSSVGLTISGGSKTIGGDNTSLNGVINMANATILRVANNNALGTSSDIADKVSMVGASILQINSGINLNKYIQTTAANTIESVGNSTLSGNLSFGGTVFFQMDGYNLTLTGNAGLGSTGSTVMTMPGVGGRLILDAEGGSEAYGLYIRGSDVTVQANNDNSFGAAGNINLGDSAGKGTLALNGVTIANNAFLAGSASSRTIENMSEGSSTYSGQIFLGTFSTIVRSTTAGTLNISGNLRDDTGTGAIEIGSATSVNSGTVKLSRASGNTYDGTTTVNSGTLLVSNTSGSATGTGAVTVSNGATIAGTGIIEGALTVNGVLSPGNTSSIGTLTVTNSAVTWDGAASAGAATDWQFDLGAANAADKLNITGGSGNFTQGTGSIFRFDFKGSTNAGTFNLVQWAGATTFASTNFSYTNLGAGLKGSFQFNGSQLEFVSESKGIPSITTPPTASAITAGQALSSSALTGGDASTAGTFTFTDSSIIPNTTGDYSADVTFTPDDLANYITATTTVSVTVNAETPIGTTFAGWSGEGALTSDSLTKYAIGGAGSLTGESVKQTSALDGTTLSITAIVRTDDAKLTVVGQAVTSLGDYATPASVVEVAGDATGIDQTGVPTGCAKQKFSVDRAGAGKKFLRLKATLQP